MRVGLLTYGMGERPTGIGRYAMQLAHALRGLDPSLELVLLSPSLRHAAPWQRDFRTVRTPALANLPLLVAAGPWALSRAARRLGLDILHDPCGIAPFVGRWGPVGKVVTIHDVAPLVSPQYEPWLSRLVFNTYVPWSRWTADAVITVSHASKRDLVERVGLPPRLVHVVAPSTARPTDGRLAALEARVPAVLGHYGLRAPYFLVVTDFHPRKNLKTVLDALRLVRARRPDIQLAVAGRPRWKDRDLPLRSLRRQPGVRLLGYLPDDTLGALYVGATALLMLSHLEGFGSPALEAMAHGTPVIASDRSSLPEVVGPAGLYVDPTRATDAARAMEQLLHAPDLRAALGHLGRRRAARGSWTRAALATRGIYQAVRRVRTRDIG